MAITFSGSTTVNVATAASTWSINSSAVFTSTAADEGLVLGLTGNSSVVTITGVTDDAGNAWGLAIAAARAGTSSGMAELWYARKASLSTRISVSLSANSSGTLGLGVVQRLGFPHATTSSAATAVSSVHSAASLTPTVAPTIFFTAARLLQSTVGGSSTPATWSVFMSTAVNIRTVGYYKIQTASSAETGTWNTSSRAGHVVAMAAFAEYSSLVGGGGLTLLGVQ